MDSYGIFLTALHLNPIHTDLIFRFNIPSQPPHLEDDRPPTDEGAEEETSVGSLFVLLEENKAALGLEFYSVSVSTLDEVFMKVVSKHGVGEENVKPVRRPWWPRVLLLSPFVDDWYLVMIVLTIVFQFV